MAEIIKMPKLSDTMTEGVVAKWHKKIGDQVKEGDLIAEIETDKATMEFESFYNGILLHIGVEEGKGAPVDTILAIVGTKGEDISSLIAQTSAAEATKLEPPKQSEAKQESVSETKPVSVPTSANASVNSDGRLKASPLAKAIATEKGIDLNQIKGSGDDGRIVKRDVENYTSTNSGNLSTSFDQPAFHGQSYTDTPVSQMRKVIAKRLAESKFSAPHFYLTMEVDMANAIDARKLINKEEEAKVSFNDLVIKACAVALKKHPIINSSWLGDKIRTNHQVNIGVAVAIEDGLVVPVIKNTDLKSIKAISSEVKSFARKAKEKKILPTDMEGNTFTISNMGMFGIDEFTAIINPPDACILAVGGIKEVPVVKHGQIVPGNTMKLTLSCDHRVVDGASGAAFLQTLKSYLENPILMLA
jgi:pyruvate dehydrogenase E2 component (dihydrolipoamide acetyltransferase)